MAAPQATFWNVGKPSIFGCVNKEAHPYQTPKNIASTPDELPPL